MCDPRIDLGPRCGIKIGIDVEMAVPLLDRLATGSKNCMFCFENGKGFKSGQYTPTKNFEKYPPGGYSFEICIIWVTHSIKKKIK